MAVSDPGPSNESTSYASRLAEVRVGVRGDLRISRHLFRGAPAYVVRDPISFDTYRFTPADYEIFAAIRDDRPLADIFADLVEAGRLDAGDDESFYRFVVQLHRRNFLSLPIIDSRGLYRRAQLKQRGRMKSLLMAPLFFKHPLANPDVFLDRTVRFVRPMFSAGFFVLWLALMIIAGAAALRHADRLAEPVSSIMAVGNLPVLWLTLIGLKLLHEFGHAYACKIFGGRVPEMGLYIIACTPCAYVDASAAWGFTHRRHRLIVCLAGVYVELTVAAAALLTWAATPPSLLNSIAYNTAFLASVVTILFNINPLMRYDGYYALSDLLEIPNLRSRAKAAVTGVLKRFLLGIRTPGINADFGAPTRVFLFVFGLASTLYRASVVLGIAMLIASKLFLLGMVLAGAFVASQVIRHARSLLMFLLRSPETAAVRPRAAALAVVVFAAIPTAIFLAPTPAHVFADGVVVPQREDVIRARTGGFLQQVCVEAGDRVEAGAPLATLSNPAVERAVIESSAACEAAAIECGAAAGVDAAAAAKGAGRRRAQETALAAARQRQADLQPRAACSGVVVRCLDAGQRGRFVEAGEPVAAVVSGGWRVRLVLDEAEFTEAAPSVGAAASFRSAADAGWVARGRIVRIAPAASKEIRHAALTQIGGGDVAVDPRTGRAGSPCFELTIDLDGDVPEALRCGMTGEIRLGSATERLGARLARRARRLFNRLQP